VQDHAGQPPEPVSATGIARRHVMRAADAFLFTSTAQAIDWVRGGFIDPSRVYDVPEASTTLRPVERATARAISGIVGQPAVLWVGRLDANKDPLTVLDGFERALTALPGATLTMVYGEGRLEAEVRDRVAASRALEGRVRLAGRVPHDQLASWYTAADIFVLGSRREGSGYALIEACACGATPVVTDIPAFAAITGHGAVGALWPRGDADALACALVAAARRDPEHERRRIVEHFATHLSWDVVGARARSIYEAVRDRRLARRGRCGPA
jgi:glycosyltransferase involved in cell wall biosynthesis